MKVLILTALVAVAVAVPLEETPEVKLAKLQHLKALEQAKARVTPNVYIQESPEVQLAKEQHLRAKEVQASAYLKDTPEVYYAKKAHEYAKNVQKLYAANVAVNPYVVPGSVVYSNTYPINTPYINQPYPINTPYNYYI